MESCKKIAPVPLALLLGFALVQALASEQAGAGSVRAVDFRMAPLEQVKKVNTLLRDRNGAGETMTVMSWQGEGDGQHLILPAAQVTPRTLRGQLASGSIHGVSWFRRGEAPHGSCDSQSECEKKMEEMCKDAGHTGVKKTSVTITIHVDGSKTCSGDCASNGAVAFVTCNPQ